MARRGSVGGLFAPVSGLARAALNDATGGTITTYILNGKRYRQHSFLAGSTFTVLSNAQPFTGHIIGAGYNGVGVQGGAGGKILTGSFTLPSGASTVTIGATNGAASTLGSLTSANGVNGGTAGAYPSGAGGNGIQLLVDGVLTYFAGGGGAGGNRGPDGNNSNFNGVGSGGTGGLGGGGNGNRGAAGIDGPYPLDGSPGTANTGGGGGGGGEGRDDTPHGAGGAGGSGRIIVIYEIAM